MSTFYGTSKMQITLEGKCAEAYVVGELPCVPYDELELYDLPVRSVEDVEKVGEIVGHDIFKAKVDVGPGGGDYVFKSVYLAAPTDRPAYRGLRAKSYPSNIEVMLIDRDGQARGYSFNCTGDDISYLWEDISEDEWANMSKESLSALVERLAKAWVSDEVDNLMDNLNSWAWDRERLEYELKIARVAAEEACSPWVYGGIEGGCQNLWDRARLEKGD